MKKERQLNLPDGVFDRLTSYLARIDSEITKHVIAAVEASMWRQTLKSISGFVEFVRVPLSEWKRCNTIRDRQMADNLLWLMNARYPSEKFILWGASYHFCRRLASDKIGYDSVLTMADTLWTLLGEEVYSIAFSGFEGEVSQWDGTTKPLEKAFEASIEGLFEKAGHSLAFLDLRTLPSGGQWLQELQYARPLGNTWKHYPWPNHFDGLFFIRNIAPSTRIRK
jgi:erythromycin esterase-like protein